MDKPFSEKKGLAGGVVCDRNLSIFLGQREELCCIQKAVGEEQGCERERNKDKARSQSRWEKVKNMGGTGRIPVKPEELKNANYGLAIVFYTQVKLMSNCLCFLIVRKPGKNKKRGYGGYFVMIEGSWDGGQRWIEYIEQFNCTYFFCRVGVNWAWIMWNHKYLKQTEIHKSRFTL